MSKFSFLLLSITEIYFMQGIGIIELSVENSIDPDVFSKAVQVARQYKSTIVKQIQAQEETTAQQLDLLE